MDQKTIAESRTFDVLFPCCNVCLDGSTLPGVTNTKCGIKKAGTRRKLRRGGNKNKNKKNKNKKNKKKGNGNKKKGENKRKGRLDELEDEMVEDMNDDNENKDDNEEDFDDNEENNEEDNDENNEEDNNKNNDTDADNDEKTNKRKVNKRNKNKKSDTKIVGGQNAEENEYPWMVALTTKTDMNFVYCGGSLIASQWVLTAVHCIRSEDATTGVTTDTPASEINIKLGEHDTSDDDSETLIMNVGVSTYILHPDYAATDGLLNDVALLKLEKEVDLNTYIPVCLPPASTQYEGQTATATGWGTLTSGGVQPTILQEVEVTVLTLATCTSNYDGIFTITSAMVCAADPGEDSCQGDSGGPLTIPVGDNNQHTQIGVTSFGEGCAVADRPGVYADVSFAREFILCTLSTNGGATFVAS